MYGRAEARCDPCVHEIACFHLNAANLLGGLKWTRGLMDVADGNARPRLGSFPFGGR